jgi:hypothetical protein
MTYDERMTMDMYELEPYRLAVEHVGKWALTIARLSGLGIDEQPFHRRTHF